jgi:Ca-activated chloride channel family protein
MKSVDTAIVDVYSRLVNNFDGQRIGLDAYNYNNSQVFPLTDDYTLVREQLASVKKSLNYDLYSSSTEGLDAATAFYAGTGYSSDATMSSNVGLGLTGCIQHLGENKSGRSQSIILATDNEIGGVLSSDDISTTQAMLLAKRQGIRVYSLDPGVSDGGLYSSPRADIADNSRGEHATLKTYSLMTGGGYYRLTSTDVTADIIAKISSQEAKLYTGSSQYATTDTPFVWFIVLCLGFIGLIAMSWRLKL